MSFSALLIHDVLVINDSGVSGTDRYGNKLYHETSVVEKMRVQPAPATQDEEYIIDRDTRLTRFKIFAKADTTTNGTSRLVWLDRSLRVLAEPRPFYNGGALHHWEFTAEEVLG